VEQRQRLAAAYTMESEMQLPQSRANLARASYRTVQTSSLVEGANPHRLVGILFDELLKALDAMAAAARRRDFAQMGSTQARVLSVLLGLESTLDFREGGDIARNLAAIYRESRRLILRGGRECEAEHVIQARTLLATIAEAWEAIG
jgi:flagellar protein FliS